MKINKGFKFRIYPNNNQKVLIAKTFGCCRLVFNKALDYHQQEYEDGRNVGYNDYSRLLTLWKQDLDFLNEPDSTALQSSLRNLSDSFKGFFKKNTKYPKFKSKRNPVQSYISRNNSNSIRIVDERHIRLPKLGDVKIKLHRQLPECRILNATISRKNGKYYVSLGCEYAIDDPKPVLDKTHSIGIDYSSPAFGASDNEVFNMERFFRKYESRLAYEQEKLSRKKLHSKNWHKQKAKVMKVYEKIASSRKDQLHKLSRHIVQKYDFIFLEDLDLSNIAQTLNLGKSTNDNGFGMFRTFLEYKSMEKGKIVQKVDKFFPSSKLCSTCGAKNDSLKLSDRTWKCPHCGTVHDRDINASINIKREGLRLLSLAAGTAVSA